MKHRYTVLAAAVILVGCGPAKTKTNTASDNNLEALRRSWNQMSGAEQGDVCRAFRADHDAAADMIQDAAGNRSETFHEDVVFFLDELGCD